MEQITIDLIPNGKMPMLHASQYDDGRQVRINLTENRQAYTLTGNEVLSLAVRKADNTLVTMDIANTYGGKSYVEFATTEQMCAVAGLNFGELTITNNGTKVGSLNFYLACEPSPEAGGLRSRSEINNLNRQIDDYLDDVLPEQISEEVPPIVEQIVGENYPTRQEVNTALASKADVSAIPTKTSQLQNDSGFATMQAVEQALPALAEPIVEALVPTVVGDNYYTKAQTYSKTEIDTEFKTVDTYDTSTKFTPTWTAGYISPNGGYHESTSYKYSSSISVSEGDRIFIYNTNGYAVGQYRFLCCYKNGSAVEAKGGQNIANPFVVPSGVDEIVVSIANMSNPSYGIRTHEQSQEVLKLKPDVDALLLVAASEKENSFFYEFDYTSGTTFSGVENYDDICGYRVCFTAKIDSSVTGIAKLGKGIGNQYGGGIGFDGTNLYLYMGTNESPQSTKAHGLTLKDYVAIVLDAPYKANEATVTISTNGGRYSWTLSVWHSNYGHFTFTAPDDYNECKLSYTCEGLTKENWLYGDSYFSNSDNARWTKYLVTSGHTNYLLNAWGGRKSGDALTAFKTDLNMNRSPRRVVWCLGMNDKDEANAPNTSWKNCVEEVMRICEELHIELVLATIPNVPSTSALNTYKNDYVRASGYRYIDFAKAVSLNGDSTWYDNMIYSDNLHPDEQGAIALYSCAVATVPELLM